MERISLPAQRQTATAVLTRLVAGAVVICALYFGKPILLPIALALFLALILTPLVTVLDHRRVPRVVAVILVTFTVAGALLAGVTLISVQLASLVDELPSQSENIKSKVRSVRGLGESAYMDRLGQLWTDVRSEWELLPARHLADPATAPADPVASDAPPSAASVEATSDGPSWAARSPILLIPLLDFVVALGLALIMAFFILLQRETLRDRLIRLVGGSHILTTKAVDDAGERISRYLRMQLIVNASYGTLWGLGLYFIGLEYAPLCGFIAAVLRFVPYIGPWIAGLIPVALALAQFSGWSELAMILGLLAVLELSSNNFLEPMLYGRSTGVSGPALLVSAAFWTYLWGPVGLLLSGPITVCLAVVGKHFPRVAYLDVLLGADPVLEPHVGYYQRLVARDQDEATRIILAQAKLMPLDRLFDEILVPALNLMKQDRVRTDGTAADERYVVDTTREILEDLVAADSARPAAQSTRPTEIRQAPNPQPEPTRRVCILGFPARDAEDQLALEMLWHLLSDKDWEFEIESADGVSAGEWVDRVAERNATIVCIASLPPGGLSHTRYVCKKLRNRLPDIKIAVGRWGLEAGVDSDHENLRTVGVDLFATTLRETRDQLNSWLPVFGEQQSREIEATLNPVTPPATSQPRDLVSVGAADPLEVAIEP